MGIENQAKLEAHLRNLEGRELGRSAGSTKGKPKIEVYDKDRKKSVGGLITSAKTYNPAADLVLGQTAEPVAEKPVIEAVEESIPKKRKHKEMETEQTEEEAPVRTAEQKEKKKKTKSTRRLRTKALTKNAKLHYAGALFADACLKGLNGVPDVDCSFVQSSITELPFFATKGYQLIKGLPTCSSWSLDNGEMVELSGPLLSQPNNVEKLLERNEVHIREAVRRSWFQGAAEARSNGGGVATKLLGRKKLIDTGKQFNMIASWIQFMIHDWGDYLEDTNQIELVAPSSVVSQCPLKSFKFYKSKEAPTVYVSLQFCYLHER